MILVDKDGQTHNKATIKTERHGNQQMTKTQHWTELRLRQELNDTVTAVALDRVSVSIEYRAPLAGAYYVGYSGRDLTLDNTGQYKTLSLFYRPNQPRPHMYHVCLCSDSWLSRLAVHSGAEILYVQWQCNMSKVGDNGIK